jgi:hypothetical protein
VKVWLEPVNEPVVEKQIHHGTYHDSELLLTSRALLRPSPRTMVVAIGAQTGSISSLLLGGLAARYDAGNSERNFAGKALRLTARFSRRRFGAWYPGCSIGVWIATSFILRGGSVTNGLMARLTLSSTH